MTPSPASGVPPEHLLPPPVQDARRVTRSWRNRAIVGWSAYVLAVFGGTIPLLLYGAENGSGAAAVPGIALYFGFPVVWTLVRRTRWPMLSAAEDLVRQWQRLPEDPRWTASLTLAREMDRAAGDDPSTRATLQRLVGALFSLFTELRALDRSIAADSEIAVHGGDYGLHEQLVALRKSRSQQISRLVDALRELNLGLARRHAAPPAVRHDVTALLDQFDAEREAEREVDGISAARARARAALTTDPRHEKA